MRLLREKCEFDTKKKNKFSISWNVIIVVNGILIGGGTKVLFTHCSNLKPELLSAFALNCKIERKSSFVASIWSRESVIVDEELLPVNPFRRSRDSLARRIQVKRMPLLRNETLIWMIAGLNLNLEWTNQCLLLNLFMLNSKCFPNLILAENSSNWMRLVWLNQGVKYESKQMYIMYKLKRCISCKSWTASSIQSWKRDTLVLQDLPHSNLQPPTSNLQPLTQ